jgi:hypothetical protein
LGAVSGVGEVLLGVVLDGVSWVFCVCVVQFLVVP